MEEKIETKKSPILAIVLVLIVIVILVGVWYWWTKKSVTPTTPLPSGKPAEKITTKEDSVAAINQDLDSLKILNLDQEFNDIDQDLNSL
jgi:flagellar basal body-associated protein FliL